MAKCGKSKPRRKAVLAYCYTAAEVCARVLRPQKPWPVEAVFYHDKGCLSFRGGVVDHTTAAAL